MQICQQAGVQRDGGGGANSASGDREGDLAGDLTMQIRPALANSAEEGIALVQRFGAQFGAGGESRGDLGEGSMSGAKR